eukprot:TRINITY_DN2436_c0_g1_i6.p1 TRINITY_DN2436_c0_g1~~TRINITY_DN2436_c0_g1_i6.p1  ORF type:complete len:312 (-),score=74.62 TRINITY_DN2436_c0_g1_i6:50-985(-)
MWSALESVGEVEGRHSCSITTVDGNEFILIGGSNRSPDRNIQVYRWSQGNWEEVNQIEPPAQRFGHSAISRDREEIIIFGGEKVGGLVNDLLVFNVSTGEWREQLTEGLKPRPRSYHTATLVGNKMYILGGKGVTNFKDDLYVLDLDVWQWSRLTTEGDIPEPKKRHTSLYYDNKLFVWGGFCLATNQHIADLDVLDLDSLTWKQVSQKGPVPSARAGHVSIIRGDTFFLFGGLGVRSQDEGNELFYFDADDDPVTWMKRKPMGNVYPSPRCDGSFALDSNGRIVLFGGLTNPGNNVCSNEFYCLDISGVY